MAICRAGRRKFMAHVHLGVWAMVMAIGAAAVAGTPAEAPVVHFEEVVKSHPIDPVQGAVLTEVARGEQASVNVWQMTRGLPAHFHRTHEDVIIVQKGRGEV